MILRQVQTIKSGLLSGTNPQGSGRGWDPEARGKGKPQTGPLFSKDSVVRENVGGDKRGSIHLIAFICSKHSMYSPFGVCRENFKSPWTWMGEGKIASLFSLSLTEMQHVLLGDVSNKL